MRKLLDRLPRLSARNWAMLAIVLLNLCWLYNRAFEGVWKVLVVAPAFGALLHRFAKREIALNRFTLLLTACCGFLCLSALLNRKLGASALLKLVCYVTFMLYPAISPREEAPGAMRRETTSLSALIVAALLPLMALGVASMLLERPIQLPGMQNAIGSQYAWLPSARLVVLDHMNVTGKFAAVAVLLCVYLLHRRLPGAVRALLAAAIAVFALALTHTQSRTAICALCVGLGAVVFHFFCLRHRKRRWRVPAGFAVWIAASALSLALLLGAFALDAHIALLLRGESTAARAESAAQIPPEAQAAPEVEPGAEQALAPELYGDSPDADISRMLTEGMASMEGNGRPLIWRTALRYLADHPRKLLFGMGPSDIMHPIAEAYGVEFDSYAHTHNAFLELLVRGGAFCLLSMLAALATLVRPAARMLLAPEVEGDRGAYMLPVLMGTLLLMALTELPLFAVASFENLLFFLCAGHVARLDREKKLG